MLATMYISIMFMLNLEFVRGVLTGGTQTQNWADYPHKHPTNTYISGRPDHQQALKLAVKKMFRLSFLNMNTQLRVAYCLRNDKDQNNTQRPMKETNSARSSSLTKKKLQTWKNDCYENDEPYKKVTLRNKIVTKIHWMIKFKKDSRTRNIRNENSIETR